MARIPEAELERLKRETDLVGLVEAGGVVLRRHGADLLGLCPFHADREPSLVVSPAKGLWHCLGACRAGGSAIDWVMRRDRVSFRHAVEVLRGGAESAGAELRPRSRPVLAPLIETDAEDRALLVRVVDYYHEALKRSPEALAYLEKRGLTHPDLIERFRLGFADRTLGYHLPKKALKAGAEIRGRLQRLGVLRGSGHEHFRGSLVVPVLGAGGEVLELYGRKIGERLRDGTPDHLYLPGAHRGVWNQGALASAEVILCESLIDAMSFWCAGSRNVTASYGVAGFMDEHLAALRQGGVKRVLIAYDGDTAGDRAAAALVPVLEAAGIASARIRFPRGLDANAYALKVRPASKSLGLLIESAGVLSDPGAAAENETEAAKEEVTPSLAASSVPEAHEGDVLPEMPAEVRGEDVVLRVADRSYRVRGLGRNTTPDALRVNLLARRGAGLHADTLDLYVARQRAAYVQHAARELGVKEEVVRKDLGQVLLKLEALQEEWLARAREAKPERVALSARDREEALALLTAPGLLGRIVADFERCGLVGEETNRLAGYIAAVSRKLERPLAVIVQSSSAAGKTSLMDAVLGFVPEEERVQYSALTGQSLFYMEGIDLRHKVLAVVEEAGAEKASYALKLLQSEGELTIASTGKDPESGRLVTHEYRVEGPVMIFLTTTAIEIDEELLNRAVVLTVSEAREQTRRVHRAQRERRTLAGLLAREEKSSLLALHRNAQRLLRPLAVVNPYAPHLTFLDTRTRMRRDHEKYLTLIDAIALLHQYQREVKTVERAGRRLEYVEATLNDIAAANRLADAVLGRSLDELSPQSRTLLGELERMVRRIAETQGVERAEVRFSRADVRQYTGWTDFQVRTHLQRLESLEYVLAHRGSRGQCYVYELLYAGEGALGEPFVMGLLDVDALGREYDANIEGSGRENEHANAENEGPSSPQRASSEPGPSSAPVTTNRLARNVLPPAPSRISKNASLETSPPAASYVVKPAANGTHP
jgi:DNA primase